MIKAAFLDRDGTIIYERHYLGDPEGVEPMPGAIDALRSLQAAGYLLVVTTNQSGVAQGYFTEKDLIRVHQRMVALLAAEGITIAAHKYCPHGPDDACPCRKPKPGMIRQAAKELDIDLAHSVSIGDKPCDAEAGVVAGCAQNILLGEVPRDAPYQEAPDITAAVTRVLAQS